MFVISGVAGKSSPVLPDILYTPCLLFISTKNSFDISKKSSSSGKAETISSNLERGKATVVEPSVFVLLVGSFQIGKLCAVGNPMQSRVFQKHQVIQTHAPEKTPSQKTGDYTLSNPD